MAAFESGISPLIFRHYRESVCEGDREGLIDDPTARGMEGVNKTTGSQRAESYSLNAAGLAKPWAGRFILPRKTKRWCGVSSGEQLPGHQGFL